jgi:hypothetical protein
MARFQSRLLMSPVGSERWWMLEAPLVYKSDRFGLIVVPTGFIFDGNSLPRFARFINSPTDFAEAGAVHDFLYRFGFKLGVSRKLADQIYVEALVTLGMGKFQAKLRYLGLRLFGWTAYKDSSNGKSDFQN